MTAEIKEWRINYQPDFTSALREALETKEFSRELRMAHLKECIVRAENSFKGDNDRLTYEYRATTMEDFIKFLSSSGLGKQAYEEWTNRNQTFTESKEFHEGQEKRNSELKLAGKIAAITMVIPGCVPAIYGIMYGIDRIRKSFDSNFQLESLQGFDGFLANHADSIKLVAKIYGIMIGVILFGIVLKALISMKWNEYKYTNPGDAERIESPVNDFCKAIC